MNASFETILSLSARERLDLYSSTANRLSTNPKYVEKDVWVCFVLDALFNQLPAEHPKLLFKGGTSLSKAFGLINRFSEDIDLVVDRADLGFEDDRDPTIPSELSRNKRKALFEELRAECSTYIYEDLRNTLTGLLGNSVYGCRVTPDPDDKSEQSLLIEYPTLYSNNEDAYVVPSVKVEARAKSAVNPSLTCSIQPYVDCELNELSLDVRNIRTIIPERTYLDKILIFHGLHCRYRDEQRLPNENDRISRHYYDVAVITETEVGISALSNEELLEDVRNHNDIAFRGGWKRLEEAVPGTLRLVPQRELRDVIEYDYNAMQFMLFGDVLDLRRVMEQIEYVEAVINTT